MTVWYERVDTAKRFRDDGVEHVAEGADLR